MGICPLHWSQQGDWVYFGSEIKALLASGRVPAIADPRGLDHMFTFFAMGTRRTMFRACSRSCRATTSRLRSAATASAPRSSEHRYWDFDFPDAGDEDDPADQERLIDEFEATFQRAVEVRLRADVPVVGYLSGGVDSAYVVATASRLRGARDSELHYPGARQGLRRNPTGVANCPSRWQPPDDFNQRCQSHLRHLRQAHRRGRLPGAGYLLRRALVPVARGARPGLQGRAHGRRVGRSVRRLRLVQAARHELLAKQTSLPARAIGSIASPAASLPPFKSFKELKRIDDTVGGAHAQAALYQLVSIARDRYFSRDIKDRIGDHTPYDDVPLDRERMHRWSPLNQSLYYGYKVHLAGQLLNYKGDRVAMANSVETRYPYLDEDVIAFTSRLAPRWKLRGLRDKYLLRHAAARVLPREAAFRRKAMFRAPLAETFLANAPPFVRQLMSPEALRKTGYFDPETVRPRLRAHRLRSGKQGRRVQAAGLERRRRDAALAPSLHQRRPVRAAQPVAGSASRAPGSLIRPPTQSQV